MGIKGIYGEIGAGERIALSKLATEKFVETGRPLRIAVDISIWQFQVQSGKGGTNPSLRTLYYRLLRLLSLSIQPLFVFDGADKPPFKRDRRTYNAITSLPNFLAKQLLRLFGFPFVVAPGEAEAECALLQREGIVDVVLSEDVDTLMFGCGRSMRNWSSEGVRGSATPTHVSVYDSSKIVAGTSGLDREGMVLVALMSGGDYIPAGIPGCGIKVACEAARAGFGKSLFSLSETDTAGFKAWRDYLAHELRNNESKFFRVKHKALQLPETFPNQEVLGYYTHPVVSSAERIERLNVELQWDGGVDIAGLRAFVADAFEWRHKSGAQKFIRGLAPALLVWKLRTRGGAAPVNKRSASSKADEERLVKSLCGKRAHFSNDGVPEVRVKYIPTDIVELDLDTEDQDNEFVEAFDAEASPSPEFDFIVLPVNKSRSPYDPTESQRVWIGEQYVRVGVPLMFQDWEESLRNQSKRFSAKTAGKKGKNRQVAKGGVKAGALDPFVRFTKPGLGLDRTEKPGIAAQPPPPEFLDPASGTRNRLLKELDIHGANARPANGRERCVARKENAAKAVSHVTVATHTCSRRTNLGNGIPWTLAEEPPEDYSAPLPPKSKNLASDICGPSEGVGNPGPEQSLTRHEFQDNKGLASPRRAPTVPRKHRSPQPRASQPCNADLEKESVPKGPGTPRKYPPPHVENTMKERLPDSTTDFPSPGKERTPTKHRFRHSAKRSATLSKSLSPDPEREGQSSELDIARPEEGNPKAFVVRTKVDGRLNFSSPTRFLPAQHQVASSSPSPLPTSAYQPRRPPRRTKAYSPIVSPQSQRSVLGKENPSTNVDQKLQTAAKAMRIVAPRESLEGAWKEVDELEAITRDSVFVGVEVLDMTNGL